VIGVPVRQIGSNSNLSHWDDDDHAVQFFTALMKKLDWDLVVGLAE
jgi:putative aminopeptidase FrvX